MNVILLVGASRINATTGMLARAVARRIGETGHHPVLFDLYEKPLPLFDPDEDYDQHPEVNELWAQFMLAQAIVLASPEYHGSMSGRLKNALDFLAFEHFDGKAVLTLASAGGSVAFGALAHMQEVVRNLHGINCPERISIGGSERAFRTDGTIVETKIQSRVNKTTDYFLRLAKQLAGAP